MESKKPKVLILTQWYIPAFKAGGPITSVYNLVEALKSDIDFWLICGNRDHGSIEDLDVQSDVWLEESGMHVYYSSNSSLARKQIKVELTKGNWSKVYLNSLFSPTWTIYPLLLSRKNDLRCLLAPRGILGAGALQIKSFKKNLFLQLAKTFNVFSRLEWHATDDSERDEIELHFGKGAAIHVIPNLPSKVPAELEHIEGRDRKSILFLSRISRKKNLLFILQRMAEIEEPYELTVIGPSEDKAYELECREFAASAGLIVHWKGAMHPADLQNELPKYSLMVLPTLHENYGHVILQAWGHGLPVLLSENTPWRNLKEQHLGWDISLDAKQLWQEAFKEHFKMPEKELVEWRIKCHSFVREKNQDRKDVLAYQTLLSGGNES